MQNETWISWRKQRQPKCGAYARKTGKPCQAPGRQAARWQEVRGTSRVCLCCQV